jgi:hypothetical protein
MHMLAHQPHHIDPIRRGDLAFPSARCPESLYVHTVRHGATPPVPTTRPRHTITETPPVQEALDELRAKLNGDRIDFSELVILGARAKARRLPSGGDSEEARRARQELAEMILTRSVSVDLHAAEEVKHLGLIANYDDE